MYTATGTLDTNARITTFAPTPREPLPFPAIVVGSRNDPYLSLRGARRLAREWRCGFADAGEAGHINAASALGDWPFGQFLLDLLVRRAAASASPSPIPMSPGGPIADTFPEHRP